MESNASASPKCMLIFCYFGAEAADSMKRWLFWIYMIQKNSHSVGLAPPNITLKKRVFRYFACSISSF